MNNNFYTLKESFITYFFCLVATMGTSILLSIIIAGVATSMGVDVKEVQNYTSTQYMSLLLSSLVFFIVFFCINKKFKKNYFVASKLKTKFNYKIALVAVLLAVVVFLGGINITGLYNYLFAHIFPQKISTIATPNFGYFVLQLVILGVCPAVFEELVFRGIIYNGLRQKHSVTMAIIISALLFMLMHLSIYQTFYQVILGLVLGLLVYYTGSIIYGMIFHFTNNFIIILLNYISPNGSVFELVKQGELVTANWGALQIILAILFFALGVGAVILIFYLLKRYTFKHKNYFNLDTSTQALKQEQEDMIIITNDNKMKSTNNSTSYIIWATISIVGFVLLWIMNSCGG